MRKLVLLAAVAAFAWWVISRRRGEMEESATIGYEDGSSVTLDTGSPERDRLLESASGARGS